MMNPAARNPFRQYRATALAVLALLAAVPALAAPTQEDLARIKLYGNVTIAQDSVEDWGPWTEFEPPEAGPSAPLALPRGGTELYRPLAQVTPPNPVQPPPAETGCITGSLCGFSVFADLLLGGEQPTLTIAEGGDEFAVPDPHAARISVTSVTPPASGVLLPGSVRVTTTPLGNGAPMFPDSGELSLLTGEGGPFYYQRATDTEFVQALPDMTPTYFDPAAIEATTFEMTAARYMRMPGEGEVEGEEVQGLQVQQGWGVIGRVTSAADLANLRASNAQASYVGGTNRFLRDDVTGAVGANVQMNVYFGTARWDMTVNGGVDTPEVSTATSVTGATIVTGGMGFKAEGTISGANFTSTSVRAADATSISGYVQGVAYGPGVSAIGGVIDVTKTVAPVQNVRTPGNAQPAALVNGAGYTNGRFVSPFLAVRSDKVRPLPPGTAGRN